MALSEPLARRLEPLLLEHLRSSAGAAGIGPSWAQIEHRERQTREALVAVLRDPAPSERERELLAEIRAGRAPLESILAQRVREAMEAAAEALGAGEFELPGILAQVEIPHRGLDHAGLSALAQEASTASDRPILALLDPAAAEALSFQLQTLDETFIGLPDHLSVIELGDGWAGELWRLVDGLDRHLPPAPSPKPDPPVPTASSSRAPIEFGPALGRSEPHEEADDSAGPSETIRIPAASRPARPPAPSPAPSSSPAPAGNREPKKPTERPRGRSPFTSGSAPAETASPAAGSGAASSSGLSSRAPKPGVLLARRYRVIGSGRHTPLGRRFSARDELDSQRDLELEWIGPDSLSSGAISRAALALFCERRCELDHPHINPWLACGDDPSRGFWFVREARSGRTLGDLIAEEGPLEPRVVAQLVADLAGGLDAAEELGLPHLDLTPDAITVEGKLGTRSARVQIHDLGLATMIGSTPAPSDVRVDDPRTLDFWAEGRTGNERLSLTPAFAAPERVARALGRTLNTNEERADQFSLGLIALLCLEGEWPSQPGAPLAARLEGVDVSEDGARRGPRGKLGRGLFALVARLLAFDSGDRFESWQAVSESFAPLSGRSAARAPLSLAGKAAAVLAVAGLVGGLAWRERSIAAEDAVLAARRHFVGPARPRIEWDASELRAWLGSNTPQIRTPLALESPGGDPLRGWKIRWEEETLVLDAPLQWPEGLDQTDAQLVSAQTGSPLGLPFSLVWVGPSSWQLNEVELAGHALPEAGTRVEWAPDLELSFAIEGPACDLIPQAWLTSGDRRTALESSAAASGSAADERREFRTRLGEFLDQAEAPGERFEGELLVRDVAGREVRRALRLEFETGVLAPAEEPRLVTRVGREFESLPSLGDGPAGKGEFLFDPERRLGLEFQLEDPAELAWTLTTDDGRRITGQQTVQPGEPVMLEGLRELRSKPFALANLDLELSDKDLVLRPPGSSGGRWSTSLSLVSLAGPPSISVLAPAGDRSPALVPGKLLVRDEERLALEVVRRSAGPLIVEILVTDPEGGELEQVRFEGLLDESVERAAVGIELPGDGRFGVQITARRALPGDRGLGPPGDPLVVAIAIDQNSPEFVLRGLESGRVFGPLDAPHLDLIAELVDEAPGSSAVELEWKLNRTGEQEQAPGQKTLGLRDAETHGREVLSAAGGEWRLPLPFGPGQPDRDGPWQLTARAVDAAGHASEPLEIPFVVAVRGPQLDWIHPRGTSTWQADPESLEFDVRLSATDPNGVEKLVVEVFDPETPGRAVVGEMTRRSGDEYETRLELLPEWSGQEVQVSVRGTDRAGADTERRLESVRLGIVITPRPSRIERLAGARVPAMRLVEGNRDSYVFGGREDDRENAAFRLAGLEPFNLDPRRSLPRGWRIGYSAGAIEDFLLDETEVTREQFARFVAAGEDGYGRAELWPTGSIPDEVRRRALILELSAGNPKLPMTEVNWDEAAAYAAWVGKRLPSWVEWEFAARGEGYRPYPAYDEREPLASGDLAKSLHAGFAMGESPNRPRPAASPMDRSPESGILGLSGNVSEWTATPAWFGSAGDLETPAAHARAHASELLDPFGHASLAASGEFWAAGGDFSSPTLDFSTAQAWPRGHRSASRGFRCALSISEYRDRELSGSAPLGAGK